MRVPVLSSLIARPERVALIVLAVNLFAALFCAAPPANAQLTYYQNDLTGFNSDSSAVLVESFAGFTPTGARLASINRNGITYSPLAPSPDVTVVTPSNPFFTVARTLNVLTSDGDEYFQMSFAASKSAVGFDTYLNGFGPANISVYGSNGLLGSTTHTHASNAIGFFGVTSTVPITAITWKTTNGAVTNTAVGNIRAAPATSAAPEASPLVLFALGALVGIVVVRRRSAAR